MKNIFLNMQFGFDFILVYYDFTNIVILFLFDGFQVIPRAKVN